MKQFELQNITFTYPDAEKPALCDISLDIDAGEFIVLCGASGCGKSTLLRQLKPCLAPHGKLSGSIRYNGIPISSAELDQTEIGFVMQDPEKQIVTDKVWHELAFGLENMGLDNESIRLRVAEMSSFFGINSWFHKKTSELSGGQKQLLSLASVMAMHPKVIILDEPTAQLDPIAADEFINTVKKLNHELGITIILSEHRLETLFPICDRLIVMDKGNILSDCSPKDSVKRLGRDKLGFMPASVRIYASLCGDLNENVPLTVRDGRKFISKLVTKKAVLPMIKAKHSEKEPLLSMKNVWFKYEKNEPDILKGFDLYAYPGEILCFFGGNGAGKSTALAVACGLKKPYRGQVRFMGKDIAKTNSRELYNKGISALMQDPQCLFVEQTVAEDLAMMLSGLKKDEVNSKAWEVAELMDIAHLMRSHPYDLSGGEQQRAAIAKVLLTEPKLMLLDEPTKGMDAEFKDHFAKILKKLTQKGIGIVLISHDLEFCAKHGDYCAMCFDGRLVSYGTPQELFSGNTFYTTMANRISRDYIDNAITAEDVIAACLEQQNGKV